MNEVNQFHIGGNTRRKVTGHFNSGFQMQSNDIISFSFLEAIVLLIHLPKSSNDSHKDIGQRGRNKQPLRGLQIAQDAAAPDAPHTSALQSNGLSQHHSSSHGLGRQT